MKGWKDGLVKVFFVDENGLFNTIYIKLQFLYIFHCTRIYKMCFLSTFKLYNQLKTSVFINSILYIIIIYLYLFDAFLAKIKCSISSSQPNL